MEKTAKKPQKIELEKTLQARCIRLLRNNNVVFFKIISSSPSGVPDLLILPKNSQPIFCEFKSAKGKLTALQTAQIARIEATNSARVLVIKDYENFIEKLKILSVL